MLSKITSLATGLNWYKWGAILLVLIASHMFVGLGFRHRAEVACEKEKTALATKKLERVVAFTEKQLPEVKKQETKSSAIKTKVAVAGNKYEEAVQAKPELPSCDISDAEWLQWNALTDQTRP